MAVPNEADSGSGDFQNHVIRRKVVLHQDALYRLEGKDLIHIGRERREIENRTKRRCSCGEVFHSDERAIEHLKSVRSRDESTNKED